MTEILDVEAESKRREQLFRDYMLSEEMAKKRLDRLKLNDAADRRLEARTMLYQLCKRDDNPAEGCIFFIENFGWTFDPRKEVKHIPFFLFEYQRDAIRWLIDHIDNGRSE